MRTYTATELETKIRTEAGLTGSTAVTSAEILSLIDTYYSELYDLLIAAYGQPYFRSTLTIATVAGTSEYELDLTGGGAERDVLDVLGVQIALDASTDVILDPADYFAIRATLAACKNSSWRALGIQPIYNRAGSKLIIAPAPDGVYTMTVHYVPCAAKITAGGTRIDGCNGWERYIVAACLAALAGAEEADPSVWLAELARLKDRIQRRAPKRVADGPVQITRRRRTRPRGFGYANE
ncbi:MAG: hypothetical protein WC683_09455 [bacterium]|jgi:hypothetical protein